MTVKDGFAFRGIIPVPVWRRFFYCDSDCRDDDNIVREADVILVTCTFVFSVIFFVSSQNTARDGKVVQTMMRGCVPLGISVAVAGEMYDSAR